MDTHDATDGTNGVQAPPVHPQQPAQDNTFLARITLWQAGESIARFHQLLKHLPLDESSDQAHVVHARMLDRVRDVHRDLTVLLGYHQLEG